MKKVSTDSPIPFWAILLLALGLWGGEYLRRDLWAPDEARYAYVAREMVETGEFAVPHRHGEYYAHKPPLMFWMIAGFSEITGGFNALATRLPSLLGALLSLWATSRLALRWGGAGASWRATLILFTSMLFWWKGGWGQIDSLLLGLEMGAMLCLLTGGASRFALAALLMGLAILAKGPVGLLVPIVALIGGCLAAGEGRKLVHWHWLWAIPLALVPPALWLLWVRSGNPPDGYLRELLFDQNVGRAAGEYDHHNPFYYFLLTFPLELLPWSLFLPAAILGARKDGGERWKNARRLIGWALSVIVFFSLSPSKRDLYILLSFPAAAILLGLEWEALSREPRRWLSRVAAFLLMLLGLGCLGAAIFGLFKPEVVPINTLWLLPNALVGIAAAVWLLWAAGPEGRVGDRWFRGLVAGLFLSFALVGAVALPALNPIKAPRLLREVAAEHIPAEGKILLFQVMGENLALYAERPGRYFSGPKKLSKGMDEEGKGIVLLRANHWDRLNPEVQARLLSKNPFQVGSKEMIWCDFGE